MNEEERNEEITEETVTEEPVPEEIVPEEKKKFTLPKVSFTLPRINFPAIKLPKIKLPAINLPKIDLPPPAKTILALLITSAVSAGLLGAVNSLTEDKIAEVNAAKTLRAAEYVMPGKTIYATNREGLFVGANEGDEFPEYAMKAAAAGYSGNIEIAVGINRSGEVTGVAIISMSETPGIGTKVTNETFLRQFLGKKLGVEVGSGENAVDAISGATISSSAVTRGVDDALRAVADWRAENER